MLDWETKEQSGLQNSSEPTRPSTLFTYATTTEVSKSLRKHKSKKRSQRTTCGLSNITPLHSKDYDNTMTDIGGNAILEALQFNSTKKLSLRRTKISLRLKNRIKLELKSPNRYGWMAHRITNNSRHNCNHPIIDSLTVLSGSNWFGCVAQQ